MQASQHHNNTIYMIITVRSVSIQGHRPGLGTNNCKMAYSTFVLSYQNSDQHKLKNKRKQKGSTTKTNPATKLYTDSRRHTRLTLLCSHSVHLFIVHDAINQVPSLSLSLHAHTQCTHAHIQNPSQLILDESIIPQHDFKSLFTFAHSPQLTRVHTSLAVQPPSKTSAGEGECSLFILNNSLLEALAFV